MAKLELSCALTENTHTQAIIAGEIAPEGITFHTSTLYPTEVFWRQLHHAEFDVSEISIASLLIALSKGLNDWVTLPVFTVRRFFHTGVMVRADRGIDVPADLAGKRVGVPEFQQTSAVWSRGILREEFGVDPASMEWFMERNPGQSHGSATGFTPPPGIRLTYIPREKSIGRMLVDGELDALIHFSPGNNIIDRTTVKPLEHAQVRRLFSSPQAEAIRYYRETGIYPINHFLIVRRSLAERHPWIVLNIYNAFCEAQRRLAVQLAALIEPYAAVGTVPAETIAAMKADVMPYGVKAGRPAVETLVRLLHLDGLTDRKLEMDDIFAPQTLDL
jgi:4,5-dihydroxyphthalate decarboxylase